MKILRNPFLWKILFYIWIMAIAVLTSLPYSGEIEKYARSEFRWDYLQHFIFYAGLSILFYLAYGPSFRKRNRKIPWYILLTGVFFATITEVHQQFIPGRAFNPVDLGLNMAGILIGFPIGLFLYEKLIYR